MTEKNIPYVVTHDIPSVCQSYVLSSMMIVLKLGIYFFIRVMHVWRERFLEIRSASYKCMQPTIFFKQICVCDLKFNMYIELQMILHVWKKQFKKISIGSCNLRYFFKMQTNIMLNLPIKRKYLHWSSSSNLNKYYTYDNLCSKCNYTEILFAGCKFMQMTSFRK